MKSINLITFVFAWTTVRSQNVFPYYQNDLNPDRIYFVENTPEPIRNVNYNRSNVNVQVEKQRVDNTDNYEEKFSANIGAEDAKNRSPASSPSVELQPPYDKNVNRNQLSHSVVRNTSQGAPNLNRNSEPVQNFPQSAPGNVSSALINFGLNIVKAIDSRANNVVVSPYSIATLLALVQQGSLGLTQQQITAALQLTPQETAGFLKKITESIEDRELSRNILKVANNIFVAEAFDLNPAFRNVATRIFGSEVTPISFTRPDFAVRTINNWIARKTNNKIGDLVPPDAVGPYSQLVLVNAVYFKGLWQVRFRPESTQAGMFFLRDGTTKDVPYMKMRRFFKAGVDKNRNAQIISLPFEGEQYSLMVIVPQSSSLNDYVTSLTDADLERYLHFSPKEVELHMPKFSVRHDSGLNVVLRKMGITEMFGDKSELSGIGTYRTFSPQVSSAVHSAVMSIDEDGGTAAAATAFAVVALSYDDPSMILRVNKPFLAVIWDNEYSIPLFMAKIDSP